MRIKDCKVRLENFLILTPFYSIKYDVMKVMLEDSRKEKFSLRHYSRQLIIQFLYMWDIVKEDDWPKLLQSFFESYVDIKEDYSDHNFIEEVPITGYIYLNADPKICSERISKRSRKGESIPLQYLEKCHKYHEDWLLNSDISKDMFINLDCSTDSDELPKIKRTWLNQIDLFMKKIESSNNSKKESIFFPSGC